MSTSPLKYGGYPSLHDSRIDRDGNTLQSLGSSLAPRAGRTFENDEQHRIKRSRTHDPTESLPEVISLLSSDEENEDATPKGQSMKPYSIPVRHHKQPDTTPNDDDFLNVFCAGKWYPDNALNGTGGTTTQECAPPQLERTIQGIDTPNIIPKFESNAATTAIGSDGLGSTAEWNDAPWTVDDKTGHVVVNGHSLAKAQTAESPEPPRIPLKEPSLCPEQAELVDIILSGRNVFYTGSAGCGKSTVLKAFTRRLRERGCQVDIVAPTGISALGVGGSTTFVYAGWNLDTFKLPLADFRKGAHGKFIRKRLKATDVLVIDEVSMVENFHFERLNIAMQEARTSREPFGGAQVVVTGDFHQLPPVKPFEHCLQCGEELAHNRSQEMYSCKKHGIFHDEDKWAFKSEAWQLCNFVYFHLRTIHRQNDEMFIKILQKCRIGQPLLGDETDLLMNHPSATANATKLYARREEVRRENQKRFDKLLSEKFSFPCLDAVDIRPEHNLPDRYTRRSADGSLEALKDHRYEALVEFKKGMLVVLLTNLDLGMKLCNGSQGLICGYEEYDPAKLPKRPASKNSYTLEATEPIHGDYADLREKYIKMFLERKEVVKKVWPIVRFHNGVVRTIYADCSVHTFGNKRPYSLLLRTQIPLAPAWAMSIHKSQSLTLDRVIVDLTRAWEEGQVYVALSRATSLSGLKIEGDPRGLSVGRGGNSEVRRFHREKFGI